MSILISNQASLILNGSKARKIKGLTFDSDGEIIVIKSNGERFARVDWRDTVLNGDQYNSKESLLDALSSIDSENAIPAVGPDRSSPIDLSIVVELPESFSYKNIMDMLDGSPSNRMHDFVFDDNKNIVMFNICLYDPFIHLSVVKENGSRYDYILKPDDDTVFSKKDFYEEKVSIEDTDVVNTDNNTDIVSEVEPVKSDSETGVVKEKNVKVTKVKTKKEGGENEVEKSDQENK